MIKDRPVIFLHIPKTAGTTLHRIIDRQYPAEQMVTFGPDAHQSIREFKAMSQQQRAQIKMLRGHMGFGLHKHLPNAVYFTLMRDPVERVISHYYHVLRDPHHYLYQHTQQGSLSIDVFLKTKIPLMLDNGQTRLISGVWESVPFGECDTEVLELAKQNLREHFVLVGLTERFDETLCLLSLILEWPNEISYMRKNVAPKRPRQDELSSEAHSTIVACNQLDIALYEYATTLFEEKIQHYGSVFTNQVNALKFQNRIETLQNYADVISRDYQVCSHVPVVGDAIVWFRKNLTSHLREPYLDPILEKQVKFNRYLLEELQQMAERQSYLLGRISQLENYIKEQDEP